MLKVSKRTLLLVAGIVWLIAGGNIAWLGIQSFAQMGQGIWWLLIIGAAVVFTLFHVKVFSKMVGKHAVALPVTRPIAWACGTSSMYRVMP